MIIQPLCFVDIKVYPGSMKGLTPDFYRCIRASVKTGKKVYKTVLGHYQEVEEPEIWEFIMN